MNNNREIIHNIELLNNGKSTKFLDLNIQNILKNKLKKKEYNIFYPYPESEKVIFYKNIKPRVSLLEIISKENLEHRKILGSIFSLGIESSVFGDVVIYKNHYYVFVLDEIKDYFINNLLNIGKINVKLEERDLKILDNYEREYQRIEIISSSERIDTVISHLINCNRNKIKNLVKEKDIILNYEFLTNVSKKLIIGDVFSIRKYGKYKYIGVKKETQSGNLVVKINKYI